MKSVPWVVVTYKTNPGPGAAGYRPVEGVIVFPCWDTAETWLKENAHTLGRWKAFIGDPRGESEPQNPVSSYDIHVA